VSDARYLALRRSVASRARAPAVLPRVHLARRAPADCGVGSAL